MIFSLVAMTGLEKCDITSAYQHSQCYSGERPVARGPLVLDILQRSSSWLKISMVEKLIVKNLSTLDGFFTNGSPTPYGYTAGVRPIKVASLGT